MEKGFLPIRRWIRLFSIRAMSVRTQHSPFWCVRACLRWSTHLNLNSSYNWCVDLSYISFSALNYCSPFHNLTECSTHQSLCMCVCCAHCTGPYWRSPATHFQTWNISIHLIIILSSLMPPVFFSVPFCGIAIRVRVSVCCLVDGCCDE